MEPLVFPAYVKDKDGLVYELSKNTANKIECYHGVSDPIDTVEDTLQSPDAIFTSNHSADHYLYYKKNGNLYTVVVADQGEKRIDTAYKERKIKSGGLVWINSRAMG